MIRLRTAQPHRRDEHQHVHDQVHLRGQHGEDPVRTRDARYECVQQGDKSDHGALCGENAHLDAKNTEANPKTASAGADPSEPTDPTVSSASVTQLINPPAGGGAAGRTTRDRPSSLVSVARGCWRLRTHMSASWWWRLTGGER